jgi:hypothetical protein
MELKIGGQKSGGAFGPYRIYHFSNGLSLNIGGDEAFLRGGPRHYKVYESPKGTGEFEFPADSSQYASLVDKIIEEYGLDVVAATDKNFSERGGLFTTFTPAGEPTHVLPPSEAIFRIKGGYVGGADTYFSNEILGKFLKLDYYCRVILTKNLEGNLDSGALGFCANIKGAIKDGALGPNELDSLLTNALQSDHPIKDAFFLSNLNALSDDIRNTFSRACYHFARMTEYLWKINQMDIETDNMCKNLGSGDQSKEFIHSSELTDRVADEFSSSIIASYSTLDLMYRYFVFVTREPFGEPDFPIKLHFPDSQPQRAVRFDIEELPSYLLDDEIAFAIPNLSPNTFKALRLFRNDVVHNMAADEIRSSVYIGISTPFIKNDRLQYVQYLTRDIGDDGGLVRHPWVHRFYEQGLDAQCLTHKWLTQILQCIFDTIEWLARWLRNKIVMLGVVNSDFELLS